MAEFEEARHQGFSKADMAQEAKEQTDRCKALGCESCIYRDRNANACMKIIMETILYPKCPYRKEA